jgi:hypothetical protein
LVERAGHTSTPLSHVGLSTPSLARQQSKSASTPHGVGGLKQHTFVPGAPAPHEYLLEPSWPSPRSQSEIGPHDPPTVKQDDVQVPMGAFV